jgi:hypothetical protein
MRDNIPVYAAAALQQHFDLALHPIWDMDTPVESNCTWRFARMMQAVGCKEDIEIAGVMLYPVVNTHHVMPANSALNLVLVRRDIHATRQFLRKSPL